MADSREEAIKQIMESTGLPRLDAEFIYAQEQGEVEGDAIELDPDKPLPEDDEEAR